MKTIPIWSTATDPVSQKNRCKSHGPDKRIDELRQRLTAGPEASPATRTSDRWPTWRPFPPFQCPLTQYPIPIFLFITMSHPFQLGHRPPLGQMDKLASRSLAPNSKRDSLVDMETQWLPEIRTIKNHKTKKKTRTKEQNTHPKEINSEIHT